MDDMLMCRSYYSPKLSSCLAIDCLLTQGEPAPPCLSSSSSTTSTSSSSTSLNLNEPDTTANSSDHLKTYSIKKNSFIFKNVKKNVCKSNSACTSSSSECLSSDEGYVGSYSENHYEINKINRTCQNLVNIMSSLDKPLEENACFQIPALFVLEEQIESTGLIGSDELDLCEKYFPKMDDLNVFSAKLVLYDDLASSFTLESLIEIEQLFKQILDERLDAQKKDETDMASHNWRRVVEKRQMSAAIQCELTFEDQCDLNAYLNEIDMNLDYSRLDQVYLNSSNLNNDLDQCLKFSHNKMAFNLRQYHEYLLGERCAKKSLFANIQVDSIAEFVPVFDNESYTYDDNYQLEENEYELSGDGYMASGDDDAEYTMIEGDEFQESTNNFLIDTTVIAHECDELELSDPMDYDGVEYEDYEDQIYIDSLTEEDAILLLRSESEVYALQMSQATKYGLLDDSCHISCKKPSQAKSRFDSGQTDDLSKTDIFDNVFNYEENFDHQQFDYNDEYILNEENYSNLSVSLRNSLLNLRKSRRRLARLLDENSKKMSSGCASTGASSVSSSFSTSHIGLYKQHLANQSKKPCMYMLTEGRCLRSDCRFVHDFKTITCKYWLEGECLKGESCEFLHEIVECEKSSKSQAKKAKKEAKAKKDFKLDTEEFPALGLSSDKPKQSSPKTKSQSMANVVKKNAHKKQNESAKMVKEEKQKSAKQKARAAKNSSTPVIQITVKPNKQQVKKTASNSCGTSLTSSGSSSTTSSRANSKVRVKK